MTASGRTTSLRSWLLASLLLLARDGKSVVAGERSPERESAPSIDWMSPCHDAAGVITPGALGRRNEGDSVAVRGLLIPAPTSMTCTRMKCWEVDREHDLRREAKCCNRCSGLLALAEWSPPLVPQGSQLMIAVRRQGDDELLRWDAKDCQVDGVLTRSYPEVIVRGVLRGRGRAPAAAALRELPPGALVITDAAVCATGVRSLPRGPASGRGARRPPDRD